MIPSDANQSLKAAEKAAEKPIVEERPGDEVYERAKPLISGVNTTAKVFLDEFKKLMLDDMAADVALASAIDEIGEVIEYHAQNLGIERPRFDAMSITRDLSRLAKLSFLIRGAELFGFDDATIEKITIAEIERSWFESRPQADRQDRTTLKLPEELTVLLREISRSLTRKESKNAKPGQGSGTRPIGSGSNRSNDRTGGGNRGIPRGRKA